jgi:hypothetical protein
MKPKPGMLSKPMPSIINRIEDGLAGHAALSAGHADLSVLHSSHLTFQNG